MDINQVELNPKTSLRRSFGIALGFVGLLWVILLSAAALDINLTPLGVYPGAMQGLGGLISGPLVHGSWTHLLANTPPLLILGTALLYAYPRAAPLALPAIYLGSGLGVWLFARESFHIGASGLTHGLMFFIFLIGVLRRDRPAIALSMAVFFLYGGMLWSILPQSPDISFESHLFGAICGLLMAILLRERDPRPEEKRYDWENEDGDEAWPPNQAGQEEDPPNLMRIDRPE